MNNEPLTIDTTAYPPSSETQGIIIRYLQAKREKTANPQKKQRVFQTHCFFRHPLSFPTHHPII